MDRTRTDDVWGASSPYGVGDDWPRRVDQFLLDGVEEGEVERWVRSACVLCSNGCGLDIAVAHGKVVGVRGDGADRVNHGRLGPKGLYGWQAINAPDRLTTPLLRRDGVLEPVSWDAALDLLVERIQGLLASQGPGAIGCYNSGQLFLEEYFALMTLLRVGVGTHHLDGNTRLCTATADAALKETFGADGDPASYTDVDVCDTLLLVGHNVAATQTVLWSRMRDRLDGPHPPALVVIDPRSTEPARRADVHLRPLPGTNLALLNAIVRELISIGAVRADFVDAHTIGFAELDAAVAECTPEWAAGICGVPADDIRSAAAVLGRAQALLSTVLQGVYQSHQATAAACQVNNINLLLGMIGRPGAGVLQMNGQPTAQNTRETGANGDLPGLRNWQNPIHVQELAEFFDVDPLQIPHWGPPTDAMRIFRYAEQGSVGLLWIVGTNPAVSLPDLGRVRRILSQDRVFVVVQDCFPNETVELADLVLPAAMWGEKTGVFTNADRTVHLSEQAVAPPGDARADFDIFCDVARRLDLRRRSGAPLLPWSVPEQAFDDFARLTRGRPADYSGFTYDRLRESHGIQWPCSAEAPEGTERLYTDLEFPTGADTCEDFGHDLATGAAFTRQEYDAQGARGRAVLKCDDYRPPPEATSDEFPLVLTTGRVVHHFHTRTKTGRAPELVAAAPDAWVEICATDAAAHGVADGDMVRVESARGHVVVAARVTGIRAGVVFMPFHYGSIDDPGDEPRAANELTITAWDPVSKQPTFKVAAVRVARVQGAA